MKSQQPTTKNPIISVLYIILILAGLGLGPRFFANWLEQSLKDNFPLIVLVYRSTGMVLYVLYVHGEDGRIDTCGVGFRNGEARNTHVE